MQIAPEAKSTGWQIKHTRAKVFTCMVFYSSPYVPRRTSMTAPKTTIRAIISNVLNRSERRKYARIHTTKGVIEHTIPTVVTLKNFTQRNIM